MTVHGRVISSHSGSLKDRFVIGCIALCILLNGFVPRFSIDQNDYEVLNQILQSQSILIQFFSCSSLPLKIVTDLFSDSGSVGNTQKKSSGQHQPAANTSADYSIMSLDKKLASSRTQYTRATFFGTGVSLHSVISSVPLTIIHLNYPISPHPVFVALILMFFFLFARSSIPDAVVVLSRLRDNLFSQFAYANWDFYLLNDISKRSAV